MNPEKSVADMKGRIKSNLRRWTQLLAAGLAGFIGSVAYAAELIDEAERTSAAFGGGSVNSDYFLQVIVALILVIGVILVLSVLAKRFSVFPGSGAGPIKVLSGVSLGGKDRLLLIQVGNEQLLVGTSPGNVQKVHKLKQPVNPQEFQSSRSVEKSNFASILNSFTGASR